MVTPNKKLNSGPLSDYLAIKQLQRSGKAHYMYEARAGRGALCSDRVAKA